MEKIRQLSKNCVLVLLERRQGVQNAKSCITEPEYKKKQVTQKNPFIYFNYNLGLISVLLAIILSSVKLAIIQM